MFKFNKAEVKRANERLRKLETVNKLSVQSTAYRNVQKYAINEPNSMSNKFYRLVQNKDGSEGIRFITRTQFNNLSEEEQKYFNQVVKNFLGNESTTKIGIENIRRRAYDEFMNNHPDLEWTQDEYEDFWKKYSDYNSDQDDKQRYNRLTQVFDSPDVLDISENLTPDKIDNIINYTVNDYRYGDIPTKSTNKRR